MIQTTTKTTAHYLKSVVSKIIEKVIASQLLKHTEENNLLEKMQSAYKSGHNTETALLRVYNDILKAVDDKSRKRVFLVLLDLSTAFDTVDHVILHWTLGICAHYAEIVSQWPDSVCIWKWHFI